MQIVYSKQHAPPYTFSSKSGLLQLLMFEQYGAVILGSRQDCLIITPKKFIVITVQQKNKTKTPYIVGYEFGDRFSPMVMLVTKWK